MFSFAVFIKIFCPVFLVVASVGPCLLTYANIAMNYGYKKGFIAAFGCFTVDVLYITLGVFAIASVKTFVPQPLVMVLGICAGIFLLYLAYGFWHTTEESLKAKKIKNSNLAIYLQLVGLTLSSPIAIVGYTSIFSAINNVSANILSILLGAFSGAFVAHSLVVILFSSIGKKISTKTLILLNKIFACVIAFFACGIIVNVVRMFTI